MLTLHADLCLHLQGAPSKHTNLFKPPAISVKFFSHPVHGNLESLSQRQLDLTLDVEDVSSHLKGLFSSKQLIGSLTTFNLKYGFWHLKGGHM